MQIRIYDKGFNSLTVLFQGSDFVDLQYGNFLDRVGNASFTVDIKNPKVTTANVKHYNKVEISDDDGTVRWVGVIVNKKILLNIVTIQCFQLIHLLERRRSDESVSYSHAASYIVSQLLSYTNGLGYTGIIAGTINVSDVVNKDLKRASILSAISDIAQETDSQYFVNNSRQLDFKDQVGTDLSASIQMRYNKDLLPMANVIDFNVTDDGSKIRSRTYGKTSSLTSTQTDSTLLSDYGLLEDTEDFREITDQTTLDNATANANKGAEFSPSFLLAPDFTDNFEVGDIVSVVLKNELVDVSENYQIFEKSVVFRGSQKQISLRFNSNVDDIATVIKNLKKDVDTLSREV